MIALRSVVALSLAVTVAAAVPALAQEHEHGGGGAPPARGGSHGGVARPGFGRGNFHDFRGRDFAHFSPQEQTQWRGGHWRHGWHGGRWGWWWGVGGAFYFYDEPVYPYPDTVSDDVSADLSEAGPGGYAPGYWYFCSVSNTYYPYVRTCSVPWTPVPPTPPQP